MKSADNFFDRVYAVTQHIPLGKVTTYGAIAKFLGTARSARMVGWALNSSKKRLEIPAHRVVNRKGLLTGKLHFDGSNLMQQLLESEGIVVKNNQIQQLETVLWDPKNTLLQDDF